MDGRLDSCSLCFAGVAPCRSVSKATPSDGPSPSAMPKALDSSSVEVGMDTLLDELVRAALLEVTSAKGASPAPVASSAPGLDLREASGAGILAKCASTSPAPSACDLPSSGSAAPVTPPKAMACAALGGPPAKAATSMAPVTPPKATPFAGVAGPPAMASPVTPPKAMASTVAGATVKSIPPPPLLPPFPLPFGFLASCLPAY